MALYIAFREILVTALYKWSYAYSALYVEKALLIEIR
jgi:hypothetical protein